MPAERFFLYLFTHATFSVFRTRLSCSRSFGILIEFANFNSNDYAKVMKLHDGCCELDMHAVGLLCAESR